MGEWPGTGSVTLGRHGRSLALAIVALALLLRMRGLDGWWLNPDEGIYYDILTAPSWGAFWASIGWNAHPPLYYLLLRGAGALFWNFFWYRLLSVVAGCAAVYGFWLCGFELAGRGARGIVAGSVAALALACSPFAVVASQTMRPYMLLLALLTFGLYFLLRALERGSPVGLLVGYSACTFLAVATHYSALLALPVFAGVVAARLVVARRSGSGSAAGGAWSPAATRWTMAHGPPIVAVTVLYATHLGSLADGQLAANALGGWLLPYLPATPVELWLGLLGFAGMVLGDWLAAPLALFFLGTLAWGVRLRAWTPVVLGTGALGIAITLSAMGLYPFGASRHTTWLIPFVVLPTVCVVAKGVESRTRRAPALFAVALLVVALGGPLGGLTGLERSARVQPERVLLRDDMARVLAPLAALPDSVLVVMSGQAYYLLVPLFERERGLAQRESEASFSTFVWQGRTVLVSGSWDLSAGLAPPRAANALPDLVRAVDLARPDLRLGERERVALLGGGWPPPPALGGLGRLYALEGVVSAGWAVPGLELLLVDLDRLLGSIPSEAHRDRSPPSR